MCTSGQDDHQDLGSRILKPPNAIGLLKLIRYKLDDKLDGFKVDCSGKRGKFEDFKSYFCIK
jgi:hypothetical protein